MTQLVKFLFADQSLETLVNADTEDRPEARVRSHSGRRISRHGRRTASTFEIRREKRKESLKKIVSYASCFSGGVFIAACLLDLLPGKIVILGIPKGALKTSLIVFVPYKCSLVRFLAPLNRHQIKHSSRRVGVFVYLTSSHTP